MLDGVVCRAGMAIFAGGAVLLVLRGLLAAPPLGLRFDGGGALRFGLNASVVAAAVALLGSEEHTSKLQSLMRITYAVFCLKKKNESDDVGTSSTTQQIVTQSVTTKKCTHYT